MTQPTDRLQDSILERRQDPVREGGGVDDPRALARRIAEVASDIRAKDIAILDVADAVGYADHFVLCTGNTDRQTKAVHDAVLQALKDEERLVPSRIEGLGDSRWILVDYVDVVLHVFTPDAREYYRLDKLYGDVPREDIADDEA